ncbi:MAG TPA: efflux RND transporter periplasmic adaptor subunit [Polyangiaceae bacterium]|jgi:RND family efflux transporter MFP subunit|nr:efflux RND transporter periplasmic adaptor subunit [Polyangiaceae bacterium]
MTPRTDETQAHGQPAGAAGGAGARAHGAQVGHGAHELGFDLPPPAKVSKTGATLGIVAGAVVLGAAFAVGYVPHHRQQAALAEAAEGVASSSTRVSVIAPKAGSSDRAVTLPGSVQPLQETVLYARASGFVKRWLVDMGDKVTAGQLLAEIETPELDQELDQARAQLAQAQPTLQRSKANRELSAANLQRYQQLAPVGVASQADLDQRLAQSQVDEANVNVAQATIQAQEANIRRLMQLKAFNHVTAPFAGTITQRWVEVGALVTAGNGQPLYRIAALDPARVFVHVPQDVAPGIRTDVNAVVSVREYPGRTFQGKVSRAAGELDAATRTMNTEVRVPNGDGALIAGMYAEVSLTLPSPHRVFELPATALMSDASGVRVATVDGESRIHLVPVVVERDNGATIEISSGLTGGERVVKLASAEFVEGKPVEVAE